MKSSTVFVIASSLLAQTVAALPVGEAPAALDSRHANYDGTNKPDIESTAEFLDKRAPEDESVGHPCDASED